MFKQFCSAKYSNKPFLISNGKTYTFSDVKNLIVEKYNTLPKEKQILIFGEDNFDFIITFFAALFSKKEIFLVDKNSDYKKEYTYDNSVLSFKTDKNADYKINFFTSGSSGEWKVVRKSLDNLFSEAKIIGETFFSSNRKLNFSSTTTLNHLFGFTFHFFVPFVNGFVIDTNGVKYPEDVKKTNTLLVTSPSFLAKLAKYGSEFPNNPKFIVSAGAKLEDDVFEYFEKKSTVIEIYGSTETGVIAHREQSSQKYLNLFSNVEVIEYENNLLKISSDFIYEKEFLLSDYVDYSSPDKIVVKSRADRILKIFEKRISAQKVENYLKQSDYISDAYCLKIGEKLAVSAVLTNVGTDYILKNGQLQFIKLLKNYCSEKFDIIPQKWRFLPEIYKTDSGKFDKKKIEKIFSTNLSFPLVLSQDVKENQAFVELVFLDNSNFFKGHFNGFPILPGVVSLYFAVFFSECFFKTTLSPNVIRKIKFSKLVYPNEKVILKLSNSEKSVAFELLSGQNVCVSGVISKEILY